MSIYVDIQIRSPLPVVWEHTQTPALHERWDLRFSAIDYLPRPDHGLPQRFRYRTRIGFGWEISGEGHTISGQSLADGSSTSALEFWSEAPLSLIREGRGYWKYIPTANGVRFLTWYDYRTRFGQLGAICDRIAFRPLMGWATAWSFDRLRLWLEDGVDPRVAVRLTLVHIMARLALAAVFIDQAFGIQAATAARALGLAAMIGVAAALVAAWSRAWPVWLALIAVPVALNSVPLGAGVAALAAVDLLVLSGVPSARRCLRRPIAERP